MGPGGGQVQPTHVLMLPKLSPCSVHPEMGDVFCYAVLHPSPCSVIPVPEHMAQGWARSSPS